MTVLHCDAGSSHSLPTPAATDRARALNEIAQRLDTVQYGEVRAIVQDGHVVQVETLHKTRLK